MRQTWTTMALGFTASLFRLPMACIGFI